MAPDRGPGEPAEAYAERLQRHLRWQDAELARLRGRLAAEESGPRAAGRRGGAEVLLGGRGVDAPASMDGQAALVTGASQGIGFHAAAEFCRRGSRVAVTSRKWPKASRAARELADMAGRQHEAVTPMVLDTSDFDDVRRFAGEAKKLFRRLDVVVLNAGMGYGPTWPTNTTANSGHDLAYATNFLGHFLLVRLLLELLAPNASLVAVGSAAMWQGKLHQLTPKTRPRYDKWVYGQPRPMAYANSKLAELCFVKALRRRRPALRAVAMAPGRVATALLGPELDWCRGRKWLDWCGDPQTSGRLVFESAFVSETVAPEFLYPYAFPRLLFSSPVSRYLPKYAWWWPVRLMRPTFGTLHESVAPHCGVEAQERLWRWSANATAAPAWPA
ncbi:unnamed protein product [Prorocentrum cordatum]|uniref:Protochlorophyllide reductase n=1 Tax=Prorocentrum cordatum TaxID=2364126 RepID=A0ABN9P7V0_9DINO|nr:unnamed protein product [Polarella glacialis]